MLEFEIVFENQLQIMYIFEIIFGKEYEILSILFETQIDF